MLAFKIHIKIDFRSKIKYFLNDRIFILRAVMKKLIFFLIAITSQVFSQSAMEIIKKAENVIKGENAYGEISMTVVNPDYERTLKMRSWWVGNEKALIIIDSPKRERGNKTLKIGNEMWNYLKNTETTIKIPPSMMLQAWNGSDFTNDDLVRESNLEKDYKHKFLPDKTLSGELCWGVELIPNPDVAVVWGEIHYWVRKSDFIPARLDYFDEKGNMKRYMEFEEVKTLNGKKMPTIWRMINTSKEGSSTEMKVIDMKFDVKIPSRTFSFQELERGN